MSRKKKVLDYKDIKVAKVKKVDASIAELANKAKVKPSDFKNRKAYLNFIARKAGFENYYQWQKARRLANIPIGSGGRKPSKDSYALKVNLSKYTTDFYKWEQYFRKVNRGRENELKYFELITEAARTTSYVSPDIDELFNWLARRISLSMISGTKLNKKETSIIILHFKPLKIDEEEIVERVEQPEDLF